MIAHIVFFTPRASLSTGERQAILDGLTAAVSRSPHVRGCRVGRRVRHGLPGYEQAMTDHYEYALVMEFESIEGLRAYLAAPEHAAIGGFFTSAAERSLAYDFEMTDLDGARAAV